MQQELARHQMLLEKEHDRFGEINQDRQRMEQDLKQIKEKHAKKKEEVDTQMRQSILFNKINKIEIILFSFGYTERTRCYSTSITLYE
jgi:hypothetical protein